MLPRAALLVTMLAVSAGLIALPVLDAIASTPSVQRTKKNAAKSPSKRSRAAKKGKRRAAREPRSSRRVDTSDRAAHLRHAPLTFDALDRVIRCPSDMVAVAGRVCVDRYEISLRDAGTGARWSPFYPPHLDRAVSIAELYRDLHGRAPPTSLDAQLEIPPAPTFSIEAQAESIAGATPQGYLSADDASQACSAAHKRLCTEPEWVTACRGEAKRDFPYGDHYERGVCNVYRESHPSFLLHDNAARYHDDPRNNLVTFEGKPLLRSTGASERCASRWGDDAIYDMVGNLDEWVANEGGAFLGGFYSRGTESGCFSKVSAHPRTYSDYSTGTRCCADPLP